MQIEADLRKDKSPSFICTVSLCQRQGDETVYSHPDVESARKAKRLIDHSGCGGGCNCQHYLVRIPRGHIKNMKDRGHYKAGSYLRWLVHNGIVWNLDYHPEDQEDDGEMD